MAQLAVAAAGSWIGGTLAYGTAYASIASAIGWTVGAMLGNALFNTSDSQGPRLEDTRIQTTTYGANIHITYGSTRLNGNIIWSPPLTEESSSEKVGDFLGIGGSTITTYQYYADVAVGVCEGPIDHIRRIWANGNLIYSRTEDNYLNPTSPIRIYKGTETQPIDPLIAAWADANNKIAIPHRGLCYVMFDHFALEQYGNRIPEFSFEVITGVPSCPVQDRWPVDGFDPKNGSPAIPRWNLSDSKSLGAKIPTSYYFEDLQRVFVPATWSFNDSGQEMKLGCAVWDVSTYPPKQIKWIEIYDDVLVSAGGKGSLNGLLNGIHGATFNDEDPPNPAALRYESVELPSQSRLVFLSTIETGAMALHTIDAVSMELVDTLFIPYIDGPGYTDWPYYAFRGVTMSFNPHNKVLYITDSWGGDKCATIDYAGWPSQRPGRFQTVPYRTSGMVSNRTKDIYVEGYGAYSWAIPRATWLTRGSYHHYPTVDIYDANCSFCYAGWGSLTYSWIDIFDFGTYAHGEGGKKFRFYTYYDHTADVDRDLPWLVNAQQCVAVKYSRQNKMVYIVIQDVILKFDPFNGKRIELLTRFADVNKLTPWLGAADAAYTVSIFQGGNRWLTGAVMFEEHNLLGFAEQSAFDSGIYRTWLIDPASGEIVDGGCNYDGGLSNEQHFAWPIGNSYRSFATMQGGTYVYARAYGKSVSREGIRLYEIVDDVSERMGVTADHRDTTQLQDIVYGYAIGRPMTGREAIESLQVCYFFDPVESGSEMRFVMRGGAINATIPQEELAALGGPSDRDVVPPVLVTKRALEQDLPRRVTFNFSDPDRDYDPNVVYSERIETLSVNDVKFDLPVVMVSNEAIARTQTMLFESWIARTSFSFSTGPKWSYLEPTDRVYIESDNGMLRRIRITKKVEHVGGQIDWEGVEEDDGAFDREVSESLSPVDIIDSVTNQSTAWMFVMDLPLLTDGSDDRYQFSVAVNGINPGGDFVGADIYSTADNQTFTTIGTIRAGASYGYAMSALTALTTNPNDPDCLDTLTVRMHHGTLASISETDWLDGGNMAWLAGELIQFQFAELQADNTYLLSGLLRARLGTEDYTSAHKAGDAFVIIDRATTPIGTSSYIVNQYYLPVTIGTSREKALSFYVGTVKRAQQPPSPTSLRAGVGASSAISVAWDRRDRRAQEWAEYNDDRNSENEELYDIEFCSEDFAVVVRTIEDHTSTSYTYDYATWSVDFATSPLAANGIGIRVYQKSARVGRGIPASIIYVP